MAIHGNAGAEFGLGNCDAQCPRDLKFTNKEVDNEADTEDWKSSETDPNAGIGKYGSCFTEIDIWAFLVFLHLVATKKDSHL